MHQSVNYNRANARNGHSDKGRRQSASINEVARVPKPKSQQGKDWSIAIEMGLAGSTKKKQKYSQLLVSVHTS
jgi:hypothetical protein